MYQISFSKTKFKLQFKEKVREFIQKKTMRESNGFSSFPIEN